MDSFDTRLSDGSYRTCGSCLPPNEAQKGLLTVNRYMWVCAGITSEVGLATTANARLARLAVVPAPRVIAHATLACWSSLLSSSSSASTISRFGRLVWRFKTRLTVWIDAPVFSATREIRPVLTTASISALVNFRTCKVVIILGIISGSSWN